MNEKSETGGDRLWRTTATQCAVRASPAATLASAQTSSATSVPAEQLVVQTASALAMTARAAAAETEYRQSIFVGGHPLNIGWVVANLNSRRIRL